MSMKHHFQGEIRLAVSLLLKQKFVNREEIVEDWLKKTPYYGLIMKICCFPGKTEMENAILCKQRQIRMRNLHTEE